MSFLIYLLSIINCTTTTTTTNRCQGISIGFQQRDSGNQDWETLLPGASIDYAWDEPMLSHKLKVKIQSDKDDDDVIIREYNLDNIKVFINFFLKIFKIMKK